MKLKLKITNSGNWQYCSHLKSQVTFKFKQQNHNYFMNKKKKELSNKIAVKKVRRLLSTHSVRTQYDLKKAIMNTKWVKSALGTYCKKWRLNVSTVILEYCRWFSTLFEYWSTVHWNKFSQFSNDMNNFCMIKNSLN